MSIFKRLTIGFFLILITNIVIAQNLISVSFNNGAIGTKGNNAQDLNSLSKFQTLQITKAYFIQNSSVSTYQLQGNDISGTLRLVTVTNKFVDIPGKMVWSSNGNPNNYMGFLPAPTISSFNLSTYGGSSYVIDNTKNFALVLNGRTVTLTDGANLGGNASSPLSDLNAYLSTFNTSRPTGPVTVTTQTTSSTTPTISGTATLVNGESLSIEFNGVVYTTGITFSGNNWSWTVPNSVALSAGTYNVVATITNAGGYILSDNTNNELVISSTCPQTTPTLQFKLSAPNVTTSAIQGQAGVRTESFNTQSTGTLAASGAFAIGSYVKTNTASISADDVWGGSGSQYMSIATNGVVNVTLTDPSRYLGFWWGGGDASNRVTIYATCGGNEIQVGQFTTSAVTNLLAGTNITAVDGISYPTANYKRAAASNQPFAFINLEMSDPNVYFTRLEFTQTGNGFFEIDNITTSPTYGAATITTPSAPTITSITPVNGGVTVNFTAPTSNGGAAITNYEYSTDGGTTWVAASPLVTTSPLSISGLTNGTTYSIRIRGVNSIGGGAQSNAVNGIPTTPPPVITSFSPTTAGNGETVVITGTGFTGVTSVKFGNVNATSFVVNSDTQITAVVGAAASGDVYVLNSGGNSLKSGFLFKVVELKFEGNVLDQTAAHRDGVVSGALTYGTGASGQAICFTSPNVNSSSLVPNYLTLPSDLIRGRGTNFTISLRFKTNSFGAILGYQNAGVKDPSGGNYVPILYVQSDGKLSANLWQGSPLNTPLNVLSSNRVDDGNWHKVEFSAAPGSITVYIDGVLAGSSNGTIDHLTMSFNQLGAVNTAGVWTGDPIDGWFGFNGCIDEFIIIDKSLTATQIQQVTQLPLPTITSFSPTTAKSGETVTITGTNFGSASSVKIGGVEARRFTVVSATEITAIVPKNANLNNSILVTTVAGTSSTTTFTFDCANLALDFDGSNDHVVVGDRIQNLGAFSEEAWVYWKGSNTDFSEIFTKEAISAFCITNTNKLHANFGNGTIWGSGVNSTTSIPLNTWTHVAVTRSSTGLVKLYINGVLDASTATLSLTGQNSNSRVIGGKLVGATLYGSFSGTIDELKAWNTERTAQQIQSDLSDEAVGNESGLIAYYNFNQGTAAGSNTAITSLNNLTATTVINGTLTNMAKTGTSSNFVQGVWPVIISQPASTTNICSGATAALSVTAVGPQLTYQWYSNTTASSSGGTVISGATSATMSIPSTTAGTYYYYVVVTGICSQTVSSTASTVIVSSSPVAPIADANQLFCGSSPTLYKYARIIFSGLKSFGAANSIQVSEWRWLSGNNVISRTGTTVTNPNGNNPSGETPDNIYDGNTSTKWLDFNIKSGSNTSTLLFTFPGQGFEITGYSWSTANDSEERDPSAWKVFMSADGNTWTEVDSRTGINAPSARLALAGTWSYANPSGGSNANGLLATALNGHTLKWYTTATGGTGTNTSPAINASNPGSFNYFVSQVNASGCESPRTAITAIVASQPVVTYGNSYNLEITYPINDITPTSTGAVVTNYSISPALPQGLSLNTSTGVISGTPTVNSNASTYTVTSTSATGCTTVSSFTLRVFTAVAPSALSYSPASQTVRQGTAITAMAPSASGGAIVSYVISPALPAGLTFNTSTGAISGNLTAAQTGTVAYTITASNSGGSATATVTLIYNTAPTDLSVSSASVAENAASGTTVGTLSVTDADAGDTHTYTLVSGTGDTDNASFTISGNTLSTAGVFDFETKTSYSVRVRVTDAGGLSFEKVITVSVTNVNEAPTNISANTNTVVENAASGTTVATMSATDTDAGDTFTYTLVSGTGDADNASFTISGNTLSTVGVFDFETKSSYSVRVRVTDAGGLSFERVFTITVTDVNEAPTALALTSTSVLENAASGTTVGTLAGTDADAGDTFTYTLVSGTGSTDNASFTIVGNNIRTAALLDFETKSSYSVRVRVTDAAGLSFERVFTITVTDVNEAPTLTAITDRRVYNVSTSQIVNLAGITAGPETAQTTTTSVSTSNPAAFSAINIVGTQIQFTLATGIATPQDVVVTVRVKDNGGVANGGVDSVVRTFRLGIDPMPVAAASPNLITLGATSQLSATGANAVNYTWVAVGGTGIVGSGATINVRPAGTTTYAVVVTNSFGYQATIPVLLTVIIDYKLVPNNLVTPNGDGVNDKWVIPNIDMYPNNEVMVYDKAGRAVFSKRGYNNEWDGTVNGKKLKEDAYFYVIKFNKDGALPIRGYVSIVR